MKDRDSADFVILSYKMNGFRIKANIFVRIGSLQERLNALETLYYSYTRQKKLRTRWNRVRRRDIAYVKGTASPEICPVGRTYCPYSRNAPVRTHNSVRPDGNRRHKLMQWPWRHAHEKRHDVRIFLWTWFCICHKTPQPL